jgi:hypothetical protein
MIYTGIGCRRLPGRVNFTFGGWNGILGSEWGMDEIRARIDGPVLRAGETRLFGVEIFSEEIFLSRNLQ